MAVWDWGSAEWPVVRAEWLGAPHAEGTEGPFMFAWGLNVPSLPAQCGVSQHK